MRVVKIATFFSPKIENYIYSNSLDLSEWFENIYESYKLLNNIVLLLIPKQFKFYFYFYPKLRRIVDEIENDTQTNVMFVTSQKHMKCKREDPAPLFPEIKNSTEILRFILTHLRQNRIPILIDINNGAIVKEECLMCDKEGQDYPKRKLQLSLIPNVEELKKVLKDIADCNINYWHIKKDSIMASDIRYLILLMGLLHNIPIEVLSQIKNIKFHQSLLNDLRKNPKNDFNNIAFSILRANFYRPAKDSARRELCSIDWHTNDPNSELGYNLYRVDIVPPDITGIGGNKSGSERILIGIKNGQKYFIAYTKKHDFSKKQIKKRLENFQLK